jgi:hypothetical protein
MIAPITWFISGHLVITAEEFAQHYAPKIHTARVRGDAIVVGDARGVDTLAQDMLIGYKYVTVFHMFTLPRNNVGNFPTQGGFNSDIERDDAMRACSTHIIAWVRQGHEKSGTARNLAKFDVDHRG